jgi:hypothetical protein
MFEIQQSICRTQLKKISPLPGWEYFFFSRNLVENTCTDSVQARCTYGPIKAAGGFKRGPWCMAHSWNLACEVCTCSCICMHIFWVRTMQHIIACFVLLWTELLVLFLALFQHYFLVNEQYFSLTTNQHQHKLNFSEANELCPLEWRGHSNSNSVYCLLHTPCFSVHLMTSDKKLSTLS